MCQAVGGTKKDNVCKVDLSVVVVSMAESPGLSEPSQHEGRESASPSVVSDSFPPHGLHRPWDSPGQNTGVHCHSLLQGIFLSPGTEPRSAVQADSLPEYLQSRASRHPRRLPSDVGRGASSTEERPSSWLVLSECPLVSRAHRTGAGEVGDADVASAFADFKLEMGRRLST